MRARDLMTSPVVTCHSNEPMEAAARLMAERGCGSVAVVDDEGRLTGIITDRDICLAAYNQRQPLAAMLVHNAMAPWPFAVRADQSIEHVLDVMATHRVRRIPVIDDERRPIGMITIDDLARTLGGASVFAKPWTVAKALAAICQQPSTASVA